MREHKEIARKTEPRYLPPWRPFHDMQEMGSRLSRVIEDIFGGDGHEFLERPLDIWGGRGWVPAVDVEETDNEYVFEVELPGVDKENFKVEMQNGNLSISGERKEKKEEKGKNYVRHEQYYGSFRRSFSMPADADPNKIKANYKDGILTVTIQRSEAAKPKAIPIKVD